MNSFFSVRLPADGDAFVPGVPARSTLVISQIAIAKEQPNGGAVTVYVKDKKMQNPVAVCTIHPDAGVFHCKQQLFFSADGLEITAVSAGKAGGVYPTLQLCGYYEGSDDALDEESEEESEEDEEEDEKFDMRKVNKLTKRDHRGGAGRK